MTYEQRLKSVFAACNKFCNEDIIATVDFLVEEYYESKLEHESILTEVELYFSK